MDRSFKLWRSPEGESIRTADRMEQLLEHVRRCKVNIDGNVCAVIVTTLVLEVSFASESTILRSILDNFINEMNDENLSNVYFVQLFVYGLNSSHLFYWLVIYQ